MPTSPELITALQGVVGSSHVLTGEGDTAYYRTGFRYGFGGAAAVVFPGTLLEQWRVLQACVDAGAAILMQGTKTGLTGGSGPSGFDYDRDLVIVSTRRLKKIIPIAGGQQVVALPGSTLHELTQLLAPIGRVPHSVIGSTTIGATIVGGIANNAGGALCKRGVSYTELSLFARVNEAGELELVNHLGIRGLGETPEEIFATLESGQIPERNIEAFDTPASDREYGARIRNLDADVPNRYNADPRRLCDVSGSAGKVAAFAVRVDTYPQPEQTQVFFLGTNDPADFTALRRHVLAHFEDLPDKGEYMNRSILDTAKRYGKDVVLSIKHLGTKRLPTLYALKSRVEYLTNKVPFLPRFLPDLVLYQISKLFPSQIPERIQQYRDRFEHYLILVMTDGGIEEARRYLEDEWSARDGVDFFACTDAEAEAALLPRFAAAGAGIRYQNVHQKTTEEVLALDIALLGSDPDWIVDIPDDVADQIDHALYCGHFMCHVFHLDIAPKKGADVEAVKERILDVLDAKGAKYPAEHNVGHIYDADEALKAHYAALDPTNTFNPGIGRTAKRRRAMVT
ncbi:MAG: D-lactate dehydrogenase [Bacteroidota bacterium]